MAEKRTKVTVPSLSPTPLEGYEVPISESTEKWTEIKLEDGSVLRLKPNVFKVTRVDDKWDAEGNPIYAVNHTITMTIASAPDRLRKPADPGSKVN